MKRRTHIGLALATLIGSAGIAAAQTDGAATFRATTVTAGGTYAPNHVLAVWVTDAQTNFVKTLQRQAQTRIQYLRQWGPISQSNVVDAITGATLGSHQTHTLTWNCRNASGTLVPDGTYRFFVEFTEYNGAGPWTATNVLSFYKGSVGVTSYPPSQANFNNLMIMYAPAAPPPPVHDVAVAGITVPGIVPPGATTNVVVAVTNRGNFTESVTVLLSNATDRVLIGTRTASGLPAGGRTNVSFTWNTATSSTGIHTLVASAGSVAGETNAADNVATATTVVGLGVVTNTLVAKGSTWRYSDEGLDLSGTPWREAAYDDGHWAQGPAVLGFGNGGEATVLATAASVTSLQALTNAGFEQPGTGGADKATNWNGEAVGGTAMGGSWGGASRELWRSHSGGWEASVHDWGASGSGAGWWQQVTNDLGAGSLWTAGIWAWNDNGQSGIYFTNASSSYYVKIEWYDGAFQPLSQNSANIPLPGEVWTRGTVQATAPLGAAWVRFVTGAEGMSASGALQFDDASLTGFRAGRTTWYLRRDVYLDAPPAAVSANLRRDDGIALYVNGTEALRDGLPVGTLTASTAATNAVYGSAETSYVARSLNPGLFSAGRNLIAAEIHQAHGEHPVVSSVWINELHYDNTGTDANEGVEIAGPAGTDLAGYRLLLYNGGSDIYRTSSLSGIIPNQTNGCGTVWTPVPLMQNGPADGLALVRWPASVVQLLSYEGVFTATVGAAAGMVATDLGVAEPGAIGQTLQLSGTGASYSAFSWVGPIAGSTGTLNSRQGILAPEPPDLAYDLELMAVSPVANLLRSVGATAMDAPATVIAGDRATIAVTVTNSGQTVESFLVVLVDTNTGVIVASQMVNNLVAGGMAEVSFDWNTFGVSAGAHNLQAYTVRNGVTNLAASATAPFVISGSGLGLNAVSATGSIGGRCTAVAAANGLLLVGAGANLEVWDRSVPIAPVRVGAVRLPGIVESIAVNGSYAYAACGAAGVQFVDISTPSRPVHAKTFDSSGHAHALAIAGSALYVADGAAGLRIVDVSSPLSPSLAGTWHTVGPARAVVVSASRAYVLDEYDGLLILNVATPASPNLLGRYAPATAARGLALSGSHALLADDNGALSVVNVSVPASPSLSGSIRLNAFGRAIAVTGTTAYVAASDAGLLTVDVSVPSAPAIVFTNATPDAAVGISVAGSTAYLASGYAGVQTLGLSAPLAPVLQGTYPAGFRAADVAASGMIAYVAAGELGLHVVSISNAAQPVLLGSASGIANARRIALSGPLAVVGDGVNGVRIVDVTNPAAPVVVGTFANTNLVFARSVAAAGSYAAATDGRRILLINIGNPAAPILQSQFTSDGFVFDLAMTTSHLFAAAGGNGLAVLYLPSLSPAGGYNTPGMAVAVALDGTRAHVADGAGGWSVFDIGNPASPVLLGGSLGQGPVENVAAAAYLAAYAGPSNVVSALDVGAPLAPVAHGSFDRVVQVLRLASAGPYIITAEDEAGAAIFDVLPDDHDTDRMSDAWEQQIVDGNPLDGIHTVADVMPDADYDNDGLSNLSEFIAGTQPTNSASVFAIAVSAAAPGSQYVVRWYSVPGKVYNLYRSTNLTAGFSTRQAGIPASPPMNSYTDTVGSASAFYVVTVE